MSVEVRQGLVQLRCDGSYPPEEDPWGGGRCPRSVCETLPRGADPEMAAAMVHLTAELEHGWRGDYCDLCVTAGRAIREGRVRQR